MTPGLYADATPEPRIVDAHVHLLPERLSTAIRRFFESKISSDIPYPHETGPARRYLEEAGVARCWSLPYVGKSGAAAALNRWMAEAFADDDLVIPGATVHPGDDVDGVAAEAFETLGARLCKLHCSVGRFDADDAALDPLWRRVSENGRPVVVHAGHAVSGATSASEIAPIARVAERWPEARLVVAHCGAPALADMFSLMRKHPNVYADLAPVVTTPAPLGRAAMSGLEDRLLFGSDMPNVVVKIEEGIAAVRSLGLSTEHQAAILGATAERLTAQR